MEASSTSSSETSQSAIQLVKDRSLRLPLVIAIVLQCTQQLSGINAVFYYSTSILESSFPESADVITVTIGALNVVLTIVSVFLMDRAGRRALLLMYVEGKRRVKGGEKSVNLIILLLFMYV